MSLERPEHNQLWLAFHTTKAPIILKIHKVINFDILYNRVPVYPYHYNQERLFCILSWTINYVSSLNISASHICSWLSRYRNFTIITVLLSFFISQSQISGQFFYWALEAYNYLYHVFFLSVLSILPVWADSPFLVIL